MFRETSHPTTSRTSRLSGERNHSQISSLGHLKTESSWKSVTHLPFQTHHWLLKSYYSLQSTYISRFDPLSGSVVTKERRWDYTVVVTSLGQKPSWGLCPKIVLPRLSQWKVSFMGTRTMFLSLTIHSHPHCIAQCLAHSRCSVYMCWMKD